MYEYNSKKQLIKLSCLSPEQKEIDKYTVFEYCDNKKSKQTTYAKNETIEDILYFEYDKDNKKTKTLNMKNETICTFIYGENELLETALFNDSKMNFMWEKGVSKYSHKMYWYY
jgi:hypothetical protein